MGNGKRNYCACGLGNLRDVTISWIKWTIEWNDAEKRIGTSRKAGSCKSGTIQIFELETCAADNSANSKIHTRNLKHSRCIIHAHDNSPETSPVVVPVKTTAGLASVIAEPELVKNVCAPMETWVELSTKVNPFASTVTSGSIVAEPFVFGL